jgi:hypothetical protein
MDMNVVCESNVDDMAWGQVQGDQIGRIFAQLMIVFFGQ